MCVQKNVISHIFGGVPQCLEEAEQQVEASGDVRPFQICLLNSIFSLFSLSQSLSAPVLNLLSFPIPHFP